MRIRVLGWASDHGRDFPWRHVSDEYGVAVTEILLQQTTAAAVGRMYERFFCKFPGWTEMAAADVTELRAEVAHLGLGERRAARLSELASWVVENGGSLPSDREGLEAIPGVGQYVASAVLSQVHMEPEPLLDVNMARVLECVFGERERADLRDDPWLQHLARRVFPGTEAGWAVLDFAAAVCKPRPLCQECPLAERCSWFAACTVASD